MTLRATFWGLGLAAAGGLVAAGAVPGSGDWTTGPRVGVGTLLLVLAVMVVGFAYTPWLLRRFTRPADYEGTCPVGASCTGCDAFNLKPRTVCRVCGRDLDAPAGAPEAAARRDAG